jgi:nucleotide-binding universal stress UspA family protein
MQPLKVILKFFRGIRGQIEIMRSCRQSHCRVPGRDKRQSVPLTIVTTTETWSPLDMAHKMDRKTYNPIEIYEEFSSEVSKTILASAKETADQLGIQCECVQVTDRHPAEGILETATSKDCNLIVMASYGRHGVKKVLLGSVANEVLSNSTVPVLIIR